MSDLISRDAAIRVLCDLEPHTCDRATCGMSCQSVAAIKALPDALPPHGRLIDADALITKITDAAKKQPEIGDVYYEQAAEIGGWLYSMPTIIPASEEGEP